MDISEHRKTGALALALLPLLLVVAPGCGEGEKATEPPRTPGVISHPPGTYAKDGRDLPRLIVWPDGRFDCIVDGAFWCPWTGACCQNGAQRYTFYAVFSGVGGTSSDTLFGKLRGVYYGSEPDPIVIDESLFCTVWNGTGWTVDCALTGACGEPQTVSWLYPLTLLPE